MRRSCQKYLSGDTSPTIVIAPSQDWLLLCASRWTRRARRRVACSTSSDACSYACETTPPRKESVAATAESNASAHKCRT
eukprot:6191761-Pleurochrysis_carterae.AAC.1